MQAQQFYRPDGKAVPLSFLSQEELKKQIEALNSQERQAFAAQQFKGELGQFAVICDEQGYIAKIVIGSGDGHLTKAIAHAVCRIPPGHYESTCALPAFANVCWALAQYRFDRYKPCETVPRVLIVPPAQLETLLPEVQAVFRVRDLINTPANDMMPTHLADILAELAREYHAEFEQWVGDELLRDNFPAIHAVGRASVDSPRLLSLTWGHPSHPLITLVGKGVCFDTGGLDIKPSSNMRQMKKDMGGAAQVIGLAQWLMSMKLPIRLRVLIPAVENAISANAYRPGDVLTMRNGLTVEIDNTDAEGRLVLADALCLACEQKPEMLFNFATLTGAARAAVGTELSALFTPDDDLALQLSQHGEQCVDPVWRLPLYEDYQSLLDSSIADLANASSSPYAGAVTAALFLKHFIDSSVAWAHFDIMAWNVASKPGRPEGGEAMAMRAVGSLLKARFSKPLS